MVAVRGEGEGRIDVVRDAFEALGDVAWVPGVQDSIVKAPVLAALGGAGQRRGGSGDWVQLSPRAPVCGGERVDAGKPHGEAVAAWSLRQPQGFGDIWQPLCACMCGGGQGGLGGRTSHPGSSPSPAATFLPTLNR